MVGALHRRRPARRARPGLQPHARRPGRPTLGARPGRARLLPAARRLRCGQTSTCCQNVATEHAMAQKLMVDSVVTWARDYKVDGFRFDLMGHHSKANMLAVRAALDRLTPRQDGVDGQVDLPLRRGLELRRGRRQRAVRAGHPGQPRRHRHRHVLRPAARRRPRRRPVRRRPAQAGLRQRRVHRPQRRARSTRTTGGLARRTTPTWSSSGSPATCRAFTVQGQRRHDRCAATRRRLQRPPGRLRRPAGRGHHLRRRPRQRDPLRRADLQAAGRDLDGRPRPDEHHVAGHHRARPDAVVLARRAPTCCAASAWTATATTAATGSTGSTGPAPTTASATGCRRRRTTRPSGRIMKPLLANAGAQADGRPTCRPPPPQAQDLLRLRFSTPLFRLGSARESTPRSASPPPARPTPTPG